MMIAEKQSISAHPVDMMRVINCISLVSDVRNEGYETSEKNTYGDELAYVHTLQGKTPAQLYEETQRLRAWLLIYVK